MQNENTVKLKPRPYRYIVFDGKNIEEIRRFTGCSGVCRYEKDRILVPDSDFRIYIVSVGMYIVKDEKGEIAAYTKEVFDKKFESWSALDDMMHFHLFSFRQCGEDECFVMNCPQTLMAMDKFPTRKKLADLAGTDEYVKCVICHAPATVIDCHFPYDTMHNRCTKHRDALIDPVAWDEMGTAVEICREHWDFLKLKHEIEERLSWMDKHDTRVAAGVLREKLINAIKELDCYMKISWPLERMGPKKDETEAHQ